MGQEVLGKSKETGWQPVEDEPLLTDQGFKVAYPLRREDKVEGLLAVDAASASLTPDARSIIGLLADQVAIAIDDSKTAGRELTTRERACGTRASRGTRAHGGDRRARDQKSAVGNQVDCAGDARR